MTKIDKEQIPQRDAMSSPEEDARGEVKINVSGSAV
jgi:hypothetical protein